MSKPAYKRATRVADQIREEVADILLRKTKDPRLHSVTVTGVELTDDLRLAHIYVTAGQQGQDDAEGMSRLAKATGFIRAELGRRLSLRYSPALVFLKDTSGPRGDRVLALLESLKTSPQHEPDDGVTTQGKSES